MLSSWSPFQVMELLKHHSHLEAMTCPKKKKKADPPRPVVELSGHLVRQHPAGHELSMPVKQIQTSGTPRDMRHPLAHGSQPMIVPPLATHAAGGARMIPFQEGGEKSQITQPTIRVRGGNRSRTAYDRRRILLAEE
jgi:hypothetical protein